MAALNDFIWYSDVDGPWVQKPSGKGERLIIVNAITKDGWVPNAELVFKSSVFTKVENSFLFKFTIQIF